MGFLLVDQIHRVLRSTTVYDTHPIVPVSGMFESVPQVQREVV